MVALPAYGLTAHLKIGLLAALLHNVCPLSLKNDWLCVPGLLSVIDRRRCVQAMAMLAPCVRCFQRRAIEKRVLLAVSY